DLPEDYPMDWYHDEEPEGGTARPVTPSAFTRLGADYAETVLSAVDPIAATNERPRIIQESLTPLEKIELRRAVFSNIAAVLKSGQCAAPQPRWLHVRQLAPAANIVITAFRIGRSWRPFNHSPFSCVGIAHINILIFDSNTDFGIIDINIVILIHCGIGSLLF
ncbi:hypothetical protein ACJJTC_018487, partial [Scirpophaga incertulas]